MANSEAISNDENIPISKGLSDDHMSHPKHVSKGNCVSKEDHHKDDRNDSANASNGECLSKEEHEHENECRRDSANASEGHNISKEEHREYERNDSGNASTSDNVAKEEHEEGVHDDSGNASRGLVFSNAGGRYRGNNPNQKPEDIGLDAPQSSTEKARKSLHDLVKTWEREDFNSVEQLNEIKTAADFWTKYGELVYDAKQYYPTASNCPVNSTRVGAIIQQDAARTDETSATKSYRKFCKAMAKAMDQTISALSTEQTMFALELYENITETGEHRMGRITICNMLYAPKVSVSPGGMAASRAPLSNRWRANHKALIDDMAKGHTDAEFWTSFDRYIAEHREDHIGVEISTEMKSIMAHATDAASRRQKAEAINAYRDFHESVADDIDLLFQPMEPTPRKRDVVLNSTTAMPLLEIIKSTQNETVASTSASSSNCDAIQLWGRQLEEDIATLQAAMEEPDDDFWVLFYEVFEENREAFNTLCNLEQRHLYTETGVLLAMNKKDKKAAVGGYIHLSKHAFGEMDRIYGSMDEEQKAHFRHWVAVLTREHNEQPLTRKHLALKR